MALLADSFLQWRSLYSAWMVLGKGSHVWGWEPELFSPDGSMLSTIVLNTFCGAVLTFNFFLYKHCRWWITLIYFRVHIHTTGICLSRKYHNCNEQNLSNCRIQCFLCLYRNFCATTVLKSMHISCNSVFFFTQLDRIFSKAQKRQSARWKTTQISVFFI